MKTLKEVVQEVLERAGPMESRDSTRDELVAALGLWMYTGESGSMLAQRNTDIYRIYEALIDIDRDLDQKRFTFAQLEALVRHLTKVVELVATEERSFDEAQGAI